MKIWKLEPLNTSTHWSPWYDKAFGFIIAADTEARARELAAGEAGDENWSNSTWRDVDDDLRVNPWLEARFTTCVELEADSEGVVLRDFAAA